MNRFKRLPEGPALLGRKDGNAYLWVIPKGATHYRFVGDEPEWATRAAWRCVRLPRPRRPFAWVWMGLAVASLPLRSDPALTMACVILANLEANR